MGPILAIAIKDLRIFARRKASLFFAFIWPLIVAVMFGAMFRPGGTSTPRVAIVVTDDDGTGASKDFVGKLLTNTSFDAVQASRAEALELVRRGARVAAVVLRPGFGEASQRMFYGDPPAIDVFIDPSRQAERGMLEGLLQQQGAERFQTLFSNTPASRQGVQSALDDLRRSGESRPALESLLKELDTFLGSDDASSAAADEGAAGGPRFTPVEMTMQDLPRERTGPRNGYDVAIPQAMLWAVFGCVMAFGTTFVSERVRGTMVRLQVAPLTRGQVLAGKSLAALIAIALVESVLLVIGVVGFGVRLRPGPGLPRWCCPRRWRSWACSCSWRRWPGANTASGAWGQQ